ncbi:MAG TPA: hypothetical protein VN231_10755 [Allosphingosinicella sp.]|nr:hypothetical protein [Allosphingosinicella sp.]
MSDSHDPPGPDPAGAGDGDPLSRSDPSAEPWAGEDLSTQGPAQAGSSAEEGPFPWDDPPPDPAADPDAPRQRHDAFTEARKAQFLRALVKTGCILDACRLSGTAPRTVYRHQESDPRFDDHVRAALRMAATPVEITAWQRAVEGVEQPFACGGEIHVRRRYSDGLLRLLLQGSNPKKYGTRPGFTRKRLLEHERKRMERRIRAELEESLRPRTLDETRESILTKLAAIEGQRAPERLAAGWTKTPDGHWIPPGYGPLPGGSAAPDGEEPGPDTPRDSL